jgi:hypothetical protein
MKPGWVDAVWAALAGAVAFGVYLRTLAPGLVDDVDAAMFQFVGRALGVAHNPGYPLYVLLTFAFSFLPVGSLAYRINLFSALFGGLAVALSFLLCRRLGCRRVVSLAAALGMGFGQIFWSQSVVAEVYTLHAASVVAMLLALLTWGATRRPAFYFLAIAVFALGMGNHTTIVGFAPGIALYALATDRRFVLRARTLATTAALLAVGLLQYGFIILRSRQPGAYVESRATTIRELVNVMLGRQFRDRLFAFDWREVIGVRVPAIVRDVIGVELTLVGIGVAILGALWLLRHRLTDALLLLTGGLAVAVFAVNYSVIDTPVFLIPATLVLWIMAAVGAEQIVRTAAPLRGASVALAAATLLWPAWQLARNYQLNDRRQDTVTAVRVEALFEALPDGAMLVREDFLLDRLLTFGLLGDRPPIGRRIELAPPDASALRRRLETGFHVFAFRDAASRLRYEALNFSYRALPLAQGALDEFLARLPAGSLVAVAVPANEAGPFAASHGVSFGPIGGPDRLPRGAPAGMAIVGASGAHGGAIVEVGAGEVRVDVAEHANVGGTGVAASAGIEVRSGIGEAAIRQGSRDLVRTSEGAAIAVWSPSGQLIQIAVLEARDGFRVPLAAGALSAYPLRGAAARQDVSAEEWVDVRHALKTGSAILRAPAGETVVLYIRDDAPLAPRGLDRSSPQVQVDITPIDGAARSSLDEKLATRLGGAAPEEDDHVYRVELRATAGAPAAVFIALGGVPTHAFARMTAPGGATLGAIVSIDTDGLLRTPDRVSEVLLMARDDQAQLTGDGWSAVDADAVGAFRWMTASEARLVLPIALGEARRISVQLHDAAGGATTVRLSVNGAELPQQSLQTGWHAYEWRLPDGAVAQGTNEAAVIVDRISTPEGDAVPHEIAVASVRVIHNEP